VGLYHTFENGCSLKYADYVTDTIPEKTPTDGCPQNKKTCVGKSFPAAWQARHLHLSALRRFSCAAHHWCCRGHAALSLLSCDYDSHPSKKIELSKIRFYCHLQDPIHNFMVRILRGDTNQ